MTVIICIDKVRVVVDVLALTEHELSFDEIQTIVADYLLKYGMDGHLIEVVAGELMSASTVMALDIISRDFPGDLNEALRLAKERFHTFCKSKETPKWN